MPVSVNRFPFVSLTGRGDRYTWWKLWRLPSIYLISYRAGKSWAQLGGALLMVKYGLAEAVSHR